MRQIPQFGWVLSTIFLLFAVQGRAQDAPAATQRRVTAQPGYQDSPDGLQSLLNHILEVAKSEGNEPKTLALIKDMEVPDCKKWAVATFGEEKGEDWAENYSDTLEIDEGNLAEKFLKLSKENGSFFARKVEEGSKPPGSFEMSFLHSMKQPVDAFYAEWRPSANPTIANADPVGYFLFIDGKFRWDKNVHVMNLLLLPRVQGPPPSADSDHSGSGSSDESGSTRGVAAAGTAGVGFPRCSYCPPPQFPKIPIPIGTEKVLLKATVQVDGRATNIEIVRSFGSDFDEKAIEAVGKWRFHPALGPDGKPVPVTTTVEVTFRAF